MSANDEQRIKISGMIHAFRETQLVYVAAKLKISDLLLSGPKTAEELSVLTDTDKDSLYRVLRALSSLGVYEEKEKIFYLNPLGETLLSEDPNSSRPMAIMRGQEASWKPWGELLYTVQTGRNAFKKVFNMEYFDYYEKNPEAGEVFNAGMRIITGRSLKAILDSYDFSKEKYIVDVGGGNGALLMSILEKNNGCNGILYDLPHVVKEAHNYLNNEIIKKRFEISGGSMFENIPEGKDCYILKSILHDWDDERSVKILKNCRKAIDEKGKLLIIETIIEDNNAAGKLNDIHMMTVCPGGKERTKEEFEELFTKTGFKINKIFKTKGLSSIIEVVPCN